MFISAATIEVGRMKSRFGRTVLLAGVALTIGMSAAYANDYADISMLLKNGQHAEALKRTDAVLKQRPRDPQLRFLKGVILAEQNRTGEAITIFAKLTEDHPNLPEPYNNLAVLYAADNQYEKARLTLDKAIRTNPSYATAYENLGDIHAKLASMAYDKALQLDSNNSNAKSKLTMVRTLVASAPTAPAPATAATAPVVTPALPSPAAPKAPEKAVAAPAPSATKPAVPAPVAKVDPPAAEAKAPNKLEAKGAPADNDAQREAVLAIVRQWAKAWSARDVKAYLSFYGNTFDTPRGMSRKDWEAERRARIAGKGRISVTVASPQVTIKGNTATVNFRQSYESDRLKANSRKTLVLAKQGNRWQIVQEQTGG